MILARASPSPPSSPSSSSRSATDDAIQVEVIGQQWWWEYKYDIDGDGNFDGAEDITTATELVIPAGREVALTTTSNDVIHSLLDPGPQRQEGRRAGHDQPARSSRPTEAGIYRGQCTEFCGLSHANMRMLVRAVPADDFEDVGRQPADRPRRRARRAAVAKEGRKVWKQLCAQCHVINGDQRGRRSTETPPPLVSGVAPNLTHLMTRGTFAGSIFNLYGDVQSTDRTGGDNGESLGVEPDRRGRRRQPRRRPHRRHRSPPTTSTESTLEAWLRNPPAMKPDVRPGRARHAQPGPVRGADRPVGRLPRDAELS